MNSTITNVPYTAEIANFAANSTFEALPTSFVALLSIFMLDNFSAMLAGMVQPVYQSALQAVKFSHGSSGGNATYITLDGTETSLAGQMYLFGLATGSFEFDHVIEASHPSSSMFPALLCMAAAYHKSGKEFLSAMAIGYEYATRIGYATGRSSEYDKGFHAMINGAPATAAAVGNLMGWDADLIASAMGLAASSSAGLLAWINTDSMTRRTHPASMGQLGAEAAILAQAGVVGPPNIMENSYGYLNAFSADPQPELLIDGLGVEWESASQTLKILPVHARSLGFAYAVDQYRQNHNWTAADVSNITIFAGPQVLDPNNWILEPESLASAQYSIPFGIVGSLVADLRNPLNMNDELLRNQKARELTANIRNVSISDDPDYYLGYMTLNIGNELVNITIDGYPGLPEAEGYQQAAEDKYAAVVAALDLGDMGDKVKDTVAALTECEDVAVLLNDLIELGTAGVANFGKQ
jgi:2-methylcitrate dehydratase PrpD